MGGWVGEADLVGEVVEWVSGLVEQVFGVVEWGTRGG